MRRTATILLSTALTACGTGSAPEDRDAGRPPAASPSGPAAYVILTAADIDRGWDLLDVLDAELPPAQRAKIQARGLVSGGSHSMMIRFSGDCAGDRGFVAAVRFVAERHGVRTIRCASTLPEKYATRPRHGKDA